MALSPQWSKLYTADQRAKMELDSALAKVAVYIEVDGGSNDIFACTGKTPITYGGDTYDATDIVVGRRNAGGPAALIFPNAERTYSVKKYANDTLNGLTVKVHFFLRPSEADDWTHVHTATMKSHYAKWNYGDFILYLKADSEAPRRTCLAETKETCNLVFKSELCGYFGGETVCDYTIETCENTMNNLGQFRGAPSCPDPGETIETIIGWIVASYPLGADDDLSGPPTPMLQPSPNIISDW